MRLLAPVIWPGASIRKCLMGIFDYLWRASRDDAVRAFGGDANPARLGQARSKTAEYQKNAVN